MSNEDNTLYLRGRINDNDVVVRSRPNVSDVVVVKSLCSL